MHPVHLRRSFLAKQTRNHLHTYILQTSLYIFSYSLITRILSLSDTDYRALHIHLSDIGHQACRSIT